MLFSTKKVPVLLLGVLSATWLCLLPANAQTEIEVTRPCKDVHNDPEGAVIGCDELLRSSDLSDEVKEEIHLLRGRANINLEDWPEALVDIEAALSLNPDYARAWRMKLFTLRGMGDFPGALEAAERAISLAPDHQFAHRHKYELLQLLGREDAEETGLWQALQDNPDDFEVCRDLGRKLYLQERYFEAANILAPAMRQDPSDFDLRELFLESCSYAGNDCPVLFPEVRANWSYESCESARKSLLAAAKEAKGEGPESVSALDTEVFPDVETALPNAVMFYLSAFRDFMLDYSAAGARELKAADRMLRCYQASPIFGAERMRELNSGFETTIPLHVRDNWLDLAFHRLKEP